MVVIAETNQGSMIHGRHQDDPLRAVPYQYFVRGFTEESPVNLRRREDPRRTIPFRDIVFLPRPCTRRDSRYDVPVSYRWERWRSRQLAIDNGGLPLKICGACGSAGAFWN